MIAIAFGPRPQSLRRRAVERRVATSLAHEGLVLRKCSPRSRRYRQLGDYYLTRQKTRSLYGTWICLDWLARKYLVIGQGQQILDD